MSDVEETKSLDSIEVNIPSDEWYGGKYVFICWSWGEKNDSISKCSSIDPITRRGSIQATKFNEFQLFYCLREAPTGFGEKSIERLRELPAWVGDLLLSEAVRACNFSRKELENF